MDSWRQAQRSYSQALDDILGGCLPGVSRQRVAQELRKRQGEGARAALAYLGPVSAQQSPGEAAAAQRRALITAIGPPALLLDAARRNAQYAAGYNIVKPYRKRAHPPEQQPPALCPLPAPGRPAGKANAATATDARVVLEATQDCTPAHEEAQIQAVDAQRPSGKVTQQSEVEDLQHRPLLHLPGAQCATLHAKTTDITVAAAAAPASTHFEQRCLMSAAACELRDATLHPAWSARRTAQAARNAGVAALHAAAKKAWREARATAQRERLAALKADDVGAYLRLAQGARNAGIDRLLAGTDACLRQLTARLQASGAGQGAMAARGGGTAHADTAVSAAAATLAPDGLAALRESSEAWNRLAAAIGADAAAQPALLRGGQMREYQLRGLGWMLSLHGAGLNGILADEMGLGKTIQVIALVAHLMEREGAGASGAAGSGYTGKPFLIAAPSSVLPNWEREFSAWAPDIRLVSYRGPAPEREQLYNRRMRRRGGRGGAPQPWPFHVCLTSYEFLMGKADRPRLGSVPWAYIIVDEGHRLKNAGCKLNAELRSYSAERRLLLTGTPLQNSLGELWALLNFLMPDLFASAEDFDAWFGGAVQRGSGGGGGAARAGEGDEEDAAHAALLSEEEVLIVTSRLHQVLRPFMLRRLKEAVAAELPEKVEHLVPCPPAPYQQELVKLIERQLAGPGGVRGVNNTVMELRTICNHPLMSRLHAGGTEAWLPPHPLPPEVRLCGKLELLDRLLLKLKAGGHRVLLFCTMTRLLDVLETYLDWRGLRYLRMDGATSAAERGPLVADFNAPGSPAFVFLLSVRAGGVGLNLQAADTVIFYDTDWNPQQDAQAQARAHRIGQLRKVLVLRLQTAGTIEERVVEVAAAKRSMADRSITGGFFDGRTGAAERQRYLLDLIQAGAAGAGKGPTGQLSDAQINRLLARSEEELALFEAEDVRLREAEQLAWRGGVGAVNAEKAAGSGGYQRLASAAEVALLAEAALERAEPPDADAGREFGRGKRARGEVEYRT